MADQIAYLEAVVGADISSFRYGMSQVRSELMDTAGLSGSLSDLGRALTVGLSVPLVIAGAAGVAAFSSFDASMRNVNSIMQLSEDQFQALDQQVQTFGENTRNGADGAAQALYSIVSAGFGVNDTAQAMQLLSVASKTAEAGLADESLTAQTLATSLLAYGQGADQAQHFADVLTQTVNLGVGSMSDFASAFGQVINIGALAGVSYKELGADMAFLTQHGMSAAEAGTSLNQIITQLIKPTTGLTEAYAKLGVTSGSELIAKFGGVGGALQALGTVSGTTADDLGTLFTNVRALRGAAGILGNFDDYTQLMQSFGSTLDGVTGRAQQQQLDSFASQFDYLKSAINGFAITLGRDLMPVVQPALESIKGFFDNLNNQSPEAIQNLVKFAIVLALIPPAIWLIGLAMGNLPIVAIITGLLLLKQAWDTNFLGIQDAVKNALPIWTKALNDVHLEIITFGVNIAQDWFNIKSTFEDYFGDDFTALVHNLLVGNWAGVQKDLENIWGDIVMAFHDKLATPLKTAIGKLGDSIGWQTIINKATELTTVFIILGGYLLLVNLPTMISSLATALYGLAAGLWAALAPLIPFLLPALLIAGIFYLWETNTWGVRDAINSLGDTLRKFFGEVGNDLTTLERIVFLFDELRGDTAGANQILQFMGISVPAGANGQAAAQSGVSGALNDLLGIPNYTQNPLPGMIPYTPSTKGSAYIPSSSPSGTNVSYSNNNITIVTNDLNTLLAELRRRGIDLSAGQRA